MAAGASWSRREGGFIRAFVTGGHGFAGRHLVRALGERHEVVAPSRAELDLLDDSAVRCAIAGASPELVFHLGAVASVGRSWDDARSTVLANVTMTLNVLEAVREEAGSARVLHASSGEIYGPPERLPVTEEAALRPQNPYAASKAACDLLAGQYADAHELSIVRARAFNHAGPGQSDAYVVGTLTRQLAEAEARGDQEVLLRTGNPDSRRDFTDVRDVVRAYCDAAGLKPGAYNVASGRTASVRDIVAILEQLSEVRIRHELDPERVRKRDVPEVRGSAERLRELTGWRPEIPLARTVRDALEEWRVQLA